MLICLIYYEIEDNLKPWLTSYGNNNLVVDATSVAVNSSQIQQEKKYHGEHKRKQIGYNENREPQPLDNTNCRIVR
jgi:hypothetical protein